MSINAKFASLCHDRTFHSVVAKIVNYAALELSDKELRILAFETSKRTTRYELLRLVSEMLGKMTRGHLDQIAEAVPFTPRKSQSKRTRKNRRRPRKQRAQVPEKWADHDEDCRPSTFGEVTKEELDRELEEYMEQYPEQKRANIERELEEYFEQNPRATAESENHGEKEWAEIDRIVSRVTLVLSEYCAIQPYVKFYPLSLQYHPINLRPADPFAITHIRITGMLVDPENPPIERDLKHTLSNLWKSFSKVSVIVSKGTIVVVMARTE